MEQAPWMHSEIAGSEDRWQVSSVSHEWVEK